jgi:hypothetical protein
MATPLTNGTPFSERLLGKGLHGKLVATGFSVNPVGPTLAVENQMLFAKNVSPARPAPQTGPAAEVANYFRKLGVKPTLVTTVFEGLQPTGYPDVDIVEVALPHGTTVFGVTNALRQGALKGSPKSVSPNHVLVPAPNEYWCPYGPPANLPQAPMPYPGGVEGIDITVIDAGYIWDPTWGPTGSPHDNPLYHLTSSYPVNQAEWLQLGTSGWTWVGGTTNVVDSNGDGMLDALAGHANFVSGVIAQHCELPNIHIWNHNSAFVYNPNITNFSTEAAICRSLVMSQQNLATPVIHIGHASPFTNNIASVVWNLAFSRIDGPGLAAAGSGVGGPGASSRSLATDVVLTCPAGNQGLLHPPTQGTIRRFPAALHSAFPFVKGVASVDASGTRSPWSNHGPWVVCSAMGDEVASSFLYVDMPVEDGANPTTFAAGPPVNFRNNSWATWSGTSFASPKIAGLIAARLGPQPSASGGGVTYSPNASQAWTSLQQTFGTVHNNDVGFIFPF